MASGTWAGWMGRLAEKLSRPKSEAAAPAPAPSSTKQAAWATKLVVLVTGLACAEVGFSIAVLVVTTDQLVHATVPVAGSTCLLSDGPADICKLAFAMSVVGILLSCRPPSHTALLAALGAVWWLGFAITATVYAAAVDNKPKGRFRVAACAMAWSAAVCQLLSVALLVTAHRAGWQQLPMSEAAIDVSPMAAAYKQRKEEEEAAKAARQPGLLARISAGVQVALGRSSMQGAPAGAAGQVQVDRVAAPSALQRTSMGQV